MEDVQVRTIFITLFFALLASKSYSYEHREVQKMFTKQTTQLSSKPKNLKGVDFAERSSVESTIDDLTNSAKDPYATSLPFIASAELGDEKRYEAARTQMLNALDTLDQKPSDSPEWMRNNSFKAWMWGRVL